jgi:hypothetical protein
MCRLSASAAAFHSAVAIHCIVMHVPEDDAPLFADGFEDRTTDAWISVVP